MREGLSFSTTTYLEGVNTMKRIVSNIENLGFTIMNEPVEGAKTKAAGIVIDQTLVNGTSQGVSVRLINGKQRSAAVKLDRAALADLQTALTEVLDKEEA